MSDSESELDLDLDELSSAEDFLDYFGVDYVPSVVHVNRLHILQRFHDYMDKVTDMPESDEERIVIYKARLEQAYQDFVESDSITEKVFKVFHMNEPQSASISLDEITMQVKGG
jgi:nitrogenase-stabilizing/protective protein